MQIIRTELSQQQTKALIKACKNNGTTVYGALTAASMFACDRVFPKSIDNKLLITMTNPISLRTRLNPTIDNESLGAYIANVQQHYWFNGKEDSFWAIARQCRDDLQEAFTHCEHEQMFSLMSAITQTERYSEYFISKLMPSLLIVNNLGRLELSHKVIDWQSYSWATHLDQSSAGVYVYSVTLNDKMTLTVQSDRITPTEIETISNAILEQVDAITQHNSTQADPLSGVKDHLPRAQRE